MTKEEYKQYLQSEHWQEVRERFKEYYKNKRFCYVCRAKGVLHLHHKSYKRLGEERLSDLIYLCPDCHTKTHELVNSGKDQLWMTTKHLKFKHRKEHPEVKVSGKRNFYAVYGGRHRNGIYVNWYGPGGAYRACKHNKGAKAKGFNTREDAGNWIKQHEQQKNTSKRY